MSYPSLLHLEPLSLQQSTADPYLHRRCSNTVLSQSLWDSWVLVCIRFVWALWASLVGIGFDSKCEFAPSTISLGLLLCPWMWVSPHSCSSAYCLTGVSLTLDVGVFPLHHSLLQCCAATTCCWVQQYMHGIFSRRSLLSSLPPPYFGPR